MKSHEIGKFGFPISTPKAGLPKFIETVRNDVTQLPEILLHGDEIFSKSPTLTRLLIAAGVPSSPNEIIFNMGKEKALSADVLINYSRQQFSPLEIVKSVSDEDNNYQLNLQLKRGQDPTYIFDFKSFEDDNILQISTKDQSDLAHPFATRFYLREQNGQLFIGSNPNLTGLTKLNISSFSKVEHIHMTLFLESLGFVMANPQRYTDQYDWMNQEITDLFITLGGSKIIEDVYYQDISTQN